MLCNIKYKTSVIFFIKVMTLNFSVFCYSTSSIDWLKLYSLFNHSYKPQLHITVTYLENCKCTINSRYNHKNHTQKTM